MASLNQYRKGIYYYTKAALVYRRLRKYLKKEFSDDLKFPNTINRDYFYHSSYYNRTQQYMHANHFFGELMCLLRGEPMQAVERMRFANLSCCAPIFDDFFEKNADLQHINSLLKNPTPDLAQNEMEQLAVHFLNNILGSLPESKEFLDAAENLFKAQTESKTQTNKDLNQYQLLDISLRKGGYSGLMYGLLLEGNKTQEFTEMSYLLGSYGQLMDDIFDLFEDATDGIRTFANQSTSVENIRITINHQVDLIQTQLQKLTQVGFHSHDFKNVLGIFGTTIELALRQYEKLEKEQHVKPFQCQQLERKYWIVDMEKPANIWRLFYHSIKKLN